MEKRGKSAVLSNLNFMAGQGRGGGVMWGSGKGTGIGKKKDR